MKIVPFGKIFCTIIFGLCLSAISHAKPSSIERVEPPFWWVGMADPKLQIMIYGPDIVHSRVTLDYPGVQIEKTVTGNSDNYLFVHLNISPDARPGTLPFKLHSKKGTVELSYKIHQREKNNGIAGFDQSDVLYLIMPDRFANGDESNDNQLGVEVDRRKPHTRHGGDLAGVKKYLNYLEELGISTIWFNPILENAMPNGAYHGYATTDFYRVDPRLGTNEEYRDLVRDIHKRDMKVVMDMIFNHSGSHHWWMDDLPFENWIHQPEEYVQTTHFKWTLMDRHAPQSEKDILTKGWFVSAMPDLNQHNREMATYLIQNSIWWIEYARIDGVRVDTYPYAYFDFMTEWSKRINLEYPNFNVVGEAWYPKTVGSAWWQRESAINNLGPTHLKTVMDFELTFTMKNAFDQVSNSREGYEAGLFKLYEIIAQDFVYPDPNKLLVFLDNHDLPRFSRRDEKSLWRYKQAVAFLLTTRGIPQLYYGTEIIMPRTHANGDSARRANFPGGWPDDKTTAFTEKGRDSRQNEAFNYMKKLLHWRKKSPAVTEGKLIHYTPDHSGVYVYARIHEEQTVLVMLNGKDEKVTLDMSRFSEVLNGKKRGKDVITQKTLSLKKTVNIPARGTFVLELK